MIKDLAALRADYSRHRLSKSDVGKDPFDQFALWFNEATASQIPEPNAMHLGTSSSDNVPSGRTVLLKGFDRSGFVFFTNYESRKALDLLANPRCYLHFFWKELERQVFISGTAEKVSGSESDEYFAERPYESQIAAWASKQSSVLDSRKMLEQRFDELKAQFPEGDVPRPDFWGGFRISPTAFEFWQGRPSRLHDRIIYTPENGGWNIQRLAP
ncbi:MAG TPA: pyridoxamine 5'-phosphate oxidase [Pyrinomonadaceae bacterium]|nr:pyridoxamine 5'-phosphate oxidase [Pyrinomonadaceae bacterium]